MAHYVLGPRLLRMQQYFRAVEAVRAIRARRLAMGRTQEAPAALAAFREDYAAEGDQERRAPRLDAAPVADKSAVPDDPGQCVVVVSGLPRSGTSMMMQMPAAGPLPILSDGKRGADSDNPRGYLELEAATRLRQEREWIKEAKGKVVEIVAQLLPFLPPDVAYRVVFMERVPRRCSNRRKSCWIAWGAAARG